MAGMKPGMKSSLLSRIERLGAAKHPYFPLNNIIDISYEHITQSKPDLTEQLHSNSYLKFCFDSLVTEVADRKTFDSICELSSGNNDLGYFRYLLDPVYQGLQRDNYHLSNYSGGRGDFFTLEKLCSLENRIYKKITGRAAKYDFKNLALTFGGQGAYSALASYFSCICREGKLALFDSAYCSNYKPFARKDVNLGFVPTPADSHLPEPEVLLNYIESNQCLALFFVQFHNPSGEIYSEEVLRRIVKLLKRKNIYLLYSEAYETLDFARLKGREDRALTILRICEELGYDKLVRIKTLSKDRGFAGLRAGYMIAPEELVRFAVKYNDEISYNPPMINDQLFVLNTYLQSLSYGCSPDAGVEEWLGSPDIDRLLEKFLQDELAQLKDIHSNYRYVVSHLMGGSDSAALGRSCIENDDYQIVVPQGGINLSLRLKFLETYDQIDVFRKVFLETGLILHSAQFISKKQGYWIRITLSHDRERIRRGVETIKELRRSLDSYQFLPADSLRVRLNVPHLNFDRGVVMSSICNGEVCSPYEFISTN
jgi:aspartate/methionine/tyrosine aminotransferase